ncbi:hypothetical protein O181_104266 [Austropuccinia psidii MF-1]|uniref:Helitron helicase-like domain-containing protein n=1 Tax=Austropuccinia psidii MF-1 TaxID=1389203 RepID=A0A9Q3JM99_9BASI|nr:hypothetical protein [Austropuccinia psidii MF-1]
MYKGLTEALDGEGDIHGKKIVLPSTFSGGPRAMVQLYHDAMALVTALGRTSLFITITENPKWQEIQRCLLDDETASDRPDLISRIFNIKLQSLIRDLTKNKRFGMVKSYMYTVEFQKRGMPHAHIIVILHDQYVPWTLDAVDSLVTAEIPDRFSEPGLFKIVTSTMLHGPCTQTSRCWGRFGCKYGYPKSFVEQTSFRHDAYPAYHQRDGLTFETNGRTYTNKDVVPYPEYLSMKYECHLNVEIPYGIKELKYLYKYICKGEDRTCLNLEVNDETKELLDGRYIGPSEG